MDDFASRCSVARQGLVRRLFPGGIPRLWCPSLTHYATDGTLDRARMRAHLAFMRPFVGGFLIPGSTGEGWDMSDAELAEVVTFALGAVRELGGHVLIGVLKKTTRDAAATVRDSVAELQRRAGVEDALEALIASGVCGFTVCAPSGAERTQGEIEAALDGLLASGLPFALYQLPQVTGNEIAPRTVAALSERHPAFHLFKDSSGGDRVAESGFRGAFLVRGAEGDYLRHCAGAGGAYDGFLLSTANCFARELSEMLDRVDRGDLPAADELSRKLTALCGELLPAAAHVGFGNAFANANKAIDHFFAHGPRAAAVPPPLLHSGRRLPRDLVDRAGAALARHDLMPRRGYLADAP